MEPTQPGNKQMPDFHELEDRLIADASKQPAIVIKTKWDPKDVTEDNPYYQNKEGTDTEKFREFFEE